MKTNKAFTLIELLVVVSIIFLLTSIFISNAQEAKLKANDAAKREQARQVAIAMETYRANNEGKTPGSMNSTHKGTFAEGSMEFNAVMKSLGFETPPKSNDSSLIYYDDGTHATLLTTLESEEAQDNLKGCTTSENEYYCTYDPETGKIEIYALQGNEIASFTKKPSAGGTGGEKYVYNQKSCFTFSGGTITDYDEVNCPKDVVIPSTIWGQAVTAIDSSAFYRKQLSSVSIPNSVTSIGSYAFRDNQLTSVSIPDSVTSIGDYAFSSNRLTSVTIPNSVTSIGDFAFSSNRLTSVTIPDSVTTIRSYAFSNNQLSSVSIPNSVTSIGNSAFFSNGLSSVSIPNSVTSIGRYAFCSNKLDSVTIPSGVTSIGDYAFSTNRLTSISIPNSVTSIGRYAFSSNKLDSVTIPSGVTSISDNVFQQNQLDSVYIPDSVTSIGSNSFALNQLTSRGSVSIKTGTTYNQSNSFGTCTEASGCIVLRF